VRLHMDAVSSRPGVEPDQTLPAYCALRPAPGGPEGQRPQARLASQSASTPCAASDS
jgi:hypothetical protein